MCPERRVVTRRGAGQVVGGGIPGLSDRVRAVDGSEARAAWVSPPVAPGGASRSAGRAARAPDSSPHGSRPARGLPRADAAGGSALPSSSRGTSKHPPATRGAPTPTATGRARRLMAAPSRSVRLGAPAESDKRLVRSASPCARAWGVSRIRRQQSVQGFPDCAGHRAWYAQILTTREPCRLPARTPPLTCRL